MNHKIKYTAIVFGILLIGFVLGFLTNGRLVKYRIEKMQNFYTEKGVDRGFIRALDLTSDQMEEIGPILREHARKNRNLLHRHREDQQILFQELKAEIKPFLTEEQVEKLDSFKRSWQKRFKGEGQQKMRKGPRHNRGEGTSS